MVVGTGEALGTDRRHRRRRETIEQVLDVAAEVMADQGVAGLSLGEVARRMGMRTPSLYGYFASKHALYDALFARGWQRLLDAAMAHHRRVDEGTDLRERLQLTAEVFVRWAVEHPQYAPLMLWRPVPGFEPSAEAYEPAVAALGLLRADLTALAALGRLRPGVDVDDMVRTWTCVLTGVVTQQLANAPGQPYERGTFTATLPHVVDMLATHFGTQPT